MRENDCRNFTSDEFLQDELFIRWMLHEDADANSWWNNWLKENPDREKVVKEAQHKYTLLLSFQKNDISNREKKLAWQQLSERIDYPVAKLFNIRTLYWASTVAACLIVVTTLFLYKTYYPGKETTLFADNNLKQITLDDGTQIILHKGATLKTFSRRNRQVWLLGQGYFEVNKVKDNAKNPVPFIVHGDDFDVEVTGTVFTVNTDKTAKGVMLAEGHVAFKKGKTVTAMVPGDYLTLKGDSIFKTTVNTALYTAWKDKEFTLDNTSLAELKMLVKNVYGLELVFNNERALKNHVLNGVIGIASLQGFMETISVLLDADVKETPGRLVVTPKSLK